MDRRGAWTSSLKLHFSKFALASPRDRRIYRALDALARAYGPWWLCNDVTRPFWQPGLEIAMRPVPRGRTVWLLSDQGAWCPAPTLTFAGRVCAGGVTGSSTRVV